jgi:hypothetical protein
MYGRAPGAGPEAEAMPDVQTYFRTTRPQRLVISGGAGAGKTALALELLLALIEDRGNDDPVPLRVALAQWDTARVSLREFVVAHLVTAYGWSRTEAKVVVGQGRVLPVLDGLDEMDSALPDGAPAPDAPRCRAVLERLNAYQEGRHPGSVIVTCRTAHYAALAPRERLRDAARIEVEPVGPDQAGTYLEESGFPRDLLQPVLDELREDPAGTLASALSNPWRLSLAATVLAHDGAADLLSHATPEALETYLLDRLIAASTAQAPNPRGYRPADVERWLSRIADHLDHPGPGAKGARGARGPGPGPGPAPSTDIVLHQLWPIGGTIWVRCLHLVFIVCGVVAFADFIMGGEGSSVVAFSVGMLAVALKIGLGREVRPKRFDVRKLLTWRGLRQAGFGAACGLPVALGVGAFYAVVVTLMTKGRTDFLFLLTQGVLLGILVCPALGLYLGANAGLSDALTPRDPLRNDLMFGCVFGATFWLLFGLAFWPGLWFESELAARLGFGHLFHTPGVGDVGDQYAKYGPLYGFSSGTMADLLPRFGAGGSTALACVAGLLETVLAGVALGSAAWTRYAINVAVTARRSVLPRRLGIFLDWAYQSGLLRISGVAYQFRHAQLQHWLTGRSRERAGG